MYYLHIGSHRDLADPKERILYRFLEMLPGLLSVGTLFVALVLAVFFPVYLFVFLLVFSFYWFLRALYHTIFLGITYKRMREVLKQDWSLKLKDLELNPPSLVSKGFSRNFLPSEIYHLVLLPTYKEPQTLIEETLESLKRARYPKERLLVVLSFEERAGKERKVIAKTLEQKYANSFGEFLVTFHPADLPGEVPGHGSNDVWATKQALKKIIEPRGLSLEQVIVSAFDIDTRPFPDYFARLTYVYLTSLDPLHSSFQPIPLYLNEAWEAPVFSRTSSFVDTFWQMICQEREGKRVTFSSHAIPLKPLVEAGFKPKNIVSDDSRIFFKCYLRYHGRFSTVPLYYPVSMDPNFAPSWWQTLRNLYKQQRRWAWGMENIPFLLFGFYKDKKIPFREKLKWTVELVEGFWNWAVASLLLSVFGWIPYFFPPSTSSPHILLYLGPRTISQLMTVALLGIVVLMYISTTLLPPLPRNKPRYAYLSFVIFWLFLPLRMIFLGSLPALDAQIRWLLGKPLGFWPTPKTRLSTKVTLGES